MGISARDSPLSLSNSKSEQAVATEEKIEKFTPPGTSVGPYGITRPGRTFQPAISSVG